GRYRPARRKRHNHVLRLVRQDCAGWDEKLWRGRRYDHSTPEELPWRQDKIWIRTCGCRTNCATRASRHLVQAIEHAAWRVLRVIAEAYLKCSDGHSFEVCFVLGVS